MRLVVTRLVQMLFVLWVVATLLFYMFRLMPGDPTVAYIDSTFTEEQIQALRRTFGLDRPLHEQYVIYLGNLLVGEFGDSFHHRRPVLEVLAGVLPNTIILTLSGLLVAYVFGTLGGAWLAWKRGTWLEAVTIPTVLTLRAAPEVWRGMVVLAGCGLKRGRVPRGGRSRPGPIVVRRM